MHLQSFAFRGAWDGSGARTIRSIARDTGSFWADGFAHTHTPGGQGPARQATICKTSWTATFYEREYPRPDSELPLFRDAPARVGEASTGGIRNVVAPHGVDENGDRGTTDGLRRRSHDLVVVRRWAREPIRIPTVDGRRSPPQSVQVTAMPPSVEGPK